MYQPALPSIATSLNITTAQVQLTLTVYLASFAIGQLIYGPLSDHFGRRRTLLLGLAIFVAGAIACALATSAAVLIAARVLQGLGACAGPALGRAMIRDLYGAKGSAKAMAFVASALSIAPAIAPVFGGYIAGAAGWPWIFATLALVGMGMFVFVLLRVPETNPYVSRGTFRFVSMLGSYLQLAKSRRYLGYLAIAAVPVAGSLTFQTAAPFIIVGELGVHPSEFGLLMVSLTAAYFVGTLVANRLAVHAAVNRSIMLGSALLLVGAALQMAFALNLSLSIWSVLAPQMIWLMAMGIVMPNAMAGAVAPFPMMAGAAASLQGFAMMAAGALSSLVLSRLGAGVVSLGLMMSTLAVAWHSDLCLGYPTAVGDPYPIRLFVGLRTTKKARRGPGSVVQSRRDDLGGDGLERILRETGIKRGDLAGLRDEALVGALQIAGLDLERLVPRLDGRKLLKGRLAFRKGLLRIGGGFRRNGRDCLRGCRLRGEDALHAHPAEFLHRLELLDHGFSPSALPGSRLAR